MDQVFGAGHDQIARLLISVAPAGLEKMFFEVGQPLTDDAETAPPPTQADIEKLLEAAPRYGVEIKVPHEESVSSPLFGVESHAN